MEFEKIPTVPTADEVMDRALRRAAAAQKLKKNKDKANEEFVRSIYSSIYDKLDDTVRKFPSFDNLPKFYLDISNILFDVDRIKKSLGAVQWAAGQARKTGGTYARQMRQSEDTRGLRKQATARISSIVHQVEKDLLYLNEVRNVLRKLPEIKEDEFTVVVAGYPNVGKSSFIKLVSSALPEIAGYAFTTKCIIVGHREVGRERIQIVDTPGILDRPYEMRNEIENQALCAISNVADLILFMVDSSESCGYLIEDQFGLYENLKEVVGDVPMKIVVNKADLNELPGYMNMSTQTRAGVRDVVDLILKERESNTTWRKPHNPEEIQE
ncbi:NOG1 family protein [Methanoplanus limicola]|uniref:GTP-binding protein HSR1-related protein n=1 Tax=Methanoplanus limicola DSM 2279 TaxID=937775 RepID=H1YWE0_9EURY|nr:GTPase [Methanoplanus limicola]EHQ34862.1 GTP-binding protein HSR1-related protein [Methanoplanus limicola DSM 2279]